MQSTIDTSQAITLVQTHLAELLKNPPTTPLERLQASLFAAQAERLLLEDQGEREQIRRRTTLPEGYTVTRRSRENFAVRRNGEFLVSERSRYAAHMTAWEHFTSPVDFEHEDVDEDVDPAISKYARVHLLGHQVHVGEVECLPGGGMLINAAAVSTKGNVYRHQLTAERAGRHSVEWLTPAEWEHHLSALEKEATRTRESYRRRTTAPEGYDIVQAQDSDRFGFLCQAGLFLVAFARTNALVYAWAHFDDPEGFDYEPIPEEVRRGLLTTKLSAAELADHDRDDGRL